MWNRPLLREFNANICQDPFHSSASISALGLTILPELYHLTFYVKFLISATYIYAAELSLAKRQLYASYIYLEIPRYLP